MKEIKLSQEKIALVDDEDFKSLSKFKWYAHKYGDIYYAVRNSTISNGKQTTIQMHRQVLGITDPRVLCDHRNRDGLNNCRNNLRIATRSQNIQEGNKIIAEFDGYKFNPNYPTILYNNNRTDVRYIEDLKYHTSWDWLLPLVEKIRDKKDLPTIQATIDYLWEKYENKTTTGFDSVKDLWLAVVEFINFYKNQNK